ncbi:MAG: flagellar export protein FliJ [Anaerocolumna aminovalerica]|jgi:flagellar FliJ protein|uniref:flagellar export protein FliJ n=1 Tax=Anaerocolumna aminovalerica TaxID=1527 RepID=UPI001C0F1A8C|nr:flagellar export protein FliJ [Anaerocolumna aminovalerica]MBU5333396.1 flagellar export protein FliJ [Anaerocolumna aminovalerica]MDU6263878.1 flagellar export protein FliJ [Anaerocolumna aminovalerica]
MTKFIYKMESILQIKYKMEEQAKTAYGNAHAKLINEQKKLEELVNKRQYYEDKLTNLMHSKLKLLDIKQCENDIEIMKYYIKLQQIEVKKAEQQLEAARIRLNDAMVERKTHENLKEKAFEAFMLEYEAEQRKEIDELVSFQYNNPTDDQEEGNG